MMGREANVFRDRRCKVCQRPILSTAPQMVNHAWICRRVQKLGLVMPTIERPRVEIIHP